MYNYAQIESKIRNVLKEFRWFIEMYNGTTYFIYLVYKSISLTAIINIFWILTII